MAKRGNELREHILYAAKNVFLEMGFERASMDEIAARAQTSKRTLYAHFESKEKLFLAIIDLLGEIYGDRIKAPSGYSDDPADALVLYCARYLEGLLFVWTIRMCRMIMAEAERFPEGSRQYFELLLHTPTELLARYLGENFGLSESDSAEAARQLIETLVYPRFTRALFGIDPPSEQLGDCLNPDFDLAPVQAAVAALLETLEQREHR